MFQAANFLALLPLIVLLSCGQRIKPEREEVAFWNSKFIDSSYRFLYKDKDTGRAFHFFDSSLQQMGTATAYPKAARAALLANYHYFFSLDNKATSSAIDEALSVYSTAKLQNDYPRTYVGLLLFGGNIAYRLFEYNKANEYYFRAKKLGDAHLSPCEKAPFNYNIAMVLYKQQNFTESMHYFKQAFALQETCTPKTTANILQQQEIQSNIGLCLVQLKSYDSAMIHFDGALKIADKYKDSLGGATMDKIYGVVYGNKAQVAMAKNELEKSEQLSKQSIALNDRPGYEIENALSVKLQLAEVYSRKKDIASVSDVLSGLKQTMGQANATAQLEWRRLMASYYEQTLHTDSALHYFKSYFYLRDSISREQKVLTAADVARQLREKEQEGQITLLKKDQHITRILLWVTIVFSALALVIMYLIYQNFRRSKKSLAISLSLNKEIKRQKAAREQEANVRHKLITEAVIVAQESERSLIGLELHDNINQVLTTVKLHNEMLLEGVGDPKIILPRTLKYLQDCINEIRSLSKRLSAPTLGKISLEESVKDLIDSVNATSKVKITGQISEGETGVLRQELHLGMYRILQEQLNNILKHAEASEVVVQLERNRHTIRLCITDNGKGFVVESNKSGIGLMNMQTRAENLSGTFEVNSKPGHGCKVEVVVPCFQ